MQLGEESILIQSAKLSDLGNSLNFYDEKESLIWLLVVAGLAMFVTYTFVSTGFFREIENTKDYKVIAQIPMYGAEDLTITSRNELSFETGRIRIMSKERPDH